MPKRREAAPRRAPLLTLCVMHNGAALAVRPLPHKGDSQASSIVSARLVHERIALLPLRCIHRASVDCTAAQEVAVPLLASAMGNIVTASGPRARLRSGGNSARC